MNWPTHQLDSVADFRLGKMLDEKKNKGDFLPYLANVNVRWGEFELENLREMRFEHDEIDPFGLKYGDIVMCEGGEPGRCAIWKEQRPGMMIQKAIHRIRPHECLHHAFLYYTFLHFGRSGRLAPLFTGATIKHLPREKLALLKVPVPQMATQKRIVETLSAYDDLIENNRRRIALLDESARQLYQEWFVRLHFPGHEHSRITNGVPEGWVRITVAELLQRGEIELQTGPFGTQLKASDYSEEGAPVINVRNIGFGDVRAEKLEYIPDHVVQRLQHHVLKTGDIVFGRKGAVDRHVLIRASQEGWIQGSDCIRMRSRSERVSTLLLSLAFRESTHREWMLAQCSNKATMASLNQDVLGRIIAVLPSHRIHRELVDLASVIIDQIGVLERQSDKSRTARDLLLPRLMNGEIVV